MTSHKDQGLSILDLGPLSENVPVGDGKTLKVFGVSARGMFSVFQRFPEVGQWFKGGKLDAKMLMAQVPDAIAAIIAAACGEPGNEAAEAVADKLPVEAQLDVIDAAMRLTFKSGFGPFVNRILAMSAAAESVNYGRGSATTSPPGSRNASPPTDATPPSTSGT